MTNGFKATQQSKNDTAIEANKPDQPAGVGFIDFSDDLNSESVQDNNSRSDDEFIDEDTLLGDDDLGRPIVQRKYFPIGC